MIAYIEKVTELTNAIFFIITIIIMPDNFASIFNNSPSQFTTIWYLNQLLPLINYLNTFFDFLLSSV